VLQGGIQETQESSDSSEGMRSRTPEEVVKDPPQALRPLESLGSYLESIVMMVGRQSQMLADQSNMIAHLHAKTDWLAGTVACLKNQPKLNEEVKKTPTEEMTTKITYPQLPDSDYSETVVVKEVIDVDVDVEDTNKKSNKKNEHKDKQKRKRLKVIGDSIVNNIDIKKIEETVGSVSAPGLSGPEAKYNRTYGSKYDPRAKFPNSNQDYKIPQLLKKDMSDNLLVQALVTDITNLSKVPKTNREHIYGRAVESSENCYGRS